MRSNRSSERALLITLLLLISGFTLSSTVSSQGDLQDENAKRVSILSYHPYPDPQGDPYGVPENRSDLTKDWLQYQYNDLRYPTNHIDGIKKVEGSTQFIETLTIYRDSILDRSKDDSPFAIAMIGQLTATKASLDVTVHQLATDIGDPVYFVRGVLFEDDVHYGGDASNGIRNQRFVVRSQVKEIEVLSPDDLKVIKWNFTLDPGWNRERLGVVVYLQVEGGTPEGLLTNEVLQAGTYLFSQEGRTIQRSKGVLLEFYTATWCAACVFGDLAIDEIANEFGIRSSTVGTSRFQYLQSPSLLVITLSVMGSLALGAIVIVKVGGSNRSTKKVEDEDHVDEDEAKEGKT